MATISANALGVYQTASGQTSPLEVITSATVAGAIVPTGFPTGGYAIIIDSSGDFVGIGQEASDVFTDVTTSALTLMSLATSTTLEATNTVNETVARNGSDGSTTYIVGGAMSWSMSIDGLLDLSSAGVGTSTSVMDAARSKEYVIIKFDTGSNVQYIGQALIDSVSISGGVDDIATYSASFNGNGDLYKYTQV
jgi:predicted secreted protein